MATLKSKLILVASASDVTDARLKKAVGLSLNQRVGYPVFQSTLGRKTLYCCCSGGELREGQVYLTAIGQAAVEALLKLPMGYNDPLYMQELRIGRTPLRKKVKRVIESTPAESKICFFGDMADELDGEILRALNLVGSIRIR